MKRLFKVFTLLSTCAIITPVMSLSSCGKQNISEPSAEEKEHICAEDTNICSYSVNIKDDVNVDEITEVTVELKDVKTSDSDISISLVDTKAVRDGRKITFQVQITQQKNNKTEKSATFGVNFDCKKGSDSIFKQTINNFKITKTFDTEKHIVTANSNVTQVTIGVEPTTIDETTPVTLTFNNTRTTNIEDSKLVIFAGQNHIIENIEAVKPGTVSQVSYTKAQLQTKFSEKGFTIADNDAISFALTRVGAYTFKNNHLYKINDFNVEELVSDTDIDNLKNRFLYNDEYGDLHINDELTFPNYINSCTASKNNEVYLLKGTYYTEGKSAASSVAPLTIHGLLNNAGNTKLSTFRVWRDFLDEGEQYNYGINCESLKLTIDHVLMEGRSMPNPGAYLADGIVCPYLKCDDCDFTGSFTASKTECYFTNCTFDTTNTTKGSEGSLKNNYAVVIHGQGTAQFKDCTFTSIAKAVKFYYGELGVEKTFNFNFVNCKFNLIRTVEKHCNYFEYPIDVDAHEHTGPSIFNLSIDNDCEMNQLWKDMLTEQGATNIQLVHPNDTTDGQGKANHIIINGEQPIPFAWDPQTPVPSPE